MERLSIEALVVTAAANIRYLSNHAGSAGIFVLTARDAHLLVDFRYDTAVAALQQSPSACPGLRTWPVPGSYDEALLACLLEIGVTSIGFEGAHLSVARHDWWVGHTAGRSAGLTFQSTSRVVEALRVVKDETEVAVLRGGAAPDPGG
jgi:Xaa-Pro aminopeptidase